MALVLFVFSSCLPETLDPPYGVWLSEKPRIILYIKPEYRISVGTPSYFGFYTVNDVETKIFAQFGAGFRFAIYDLTKPRGIGVARIDRSNIYPQTLKSQTNGTTY